MGTFKRWVLNFLIFASICLTAFTCEDLKPSEEITTIQTSSSSICEKAVLNNDDKQINSDPFSFEEVMIEGNCLKVSVSYGGGCKDVNFELYQASEIMESYPPQMNLFLKLEDDDFLQSTYLYGPLF